MNYAVIDSISNVVRCFKTWKEANCFKIFNNRLDWKVIMMSF